MGNKIHQTAIIDERVELGDNNEIGPYSVLYGPLKIGNGNYIAPHVTIGTPGQDTRNPRYDSTNCLIEIGDDNIIREYTAIQKPCYRDITKIGNRVFIMQSVHVPHDAIIHDDVVLTPMVVMGGIVQLLNGANLAVGCSLHQHVIVGDYSIVSMGATVTKNVRPFSRYIPGKTISVNQYAIDKYNFSAHGDEIAEYVLKGEKPTSKEILDIVNRFERLSEASGRQTY